MSQKSFAVFRNTLANYSSDGNCFGEFLEINHRWGFQKIHLLLSLRYWKADKPKNNMSTPNPLVFFPLTSIVSLSNTLRHQSKIVLLILSLVPKKVHLNVRFSRKSWCSHLIDVVDVTIQCNKFPGLRFKNCTPWGLSWC